MKKTIIFLLACSIIFITSCSKKESETEAKPLTIGIAKIVQHVALDAIEKGIQDEIAEAGIEVQYDLQNANGDVNTAAQIANKYKSQKVAVAVGIATPIAVALANTIDTSPVIFATVTDPVGAGLVDSLKSGKNNVTGSSDAIPTLEHIKLFSEIAHIKTLGYIYTSSEANSVSSLEQVKEACRANGITLVSQSISTSAEVKQAADAIIKRVDGLYLTTDNTVFSAISAIIQVFGSAKKPIFSGDVTGAMDGGCLIASGFNYYKAGRATGKMVLDVLDGKNPSEMPVKLFTDPSETDFLVDLDAAKNCGITIPQEYIDNANYIFRNGILEK